MQLSGYFNFFAPNDIRIKDSRIGIETILDEYIYHRHSPEAIAETYPSLTLEQVYATILYYLHNQESVTQYMADWLKYCQESAKQQDENPPEYISRLRQMKASQRGIK